MRAPIDPGWGRMAEALAGGLAGGVGAYIEGKARQRQEEEMARARERREQIESLDLATRGYLRTGTLPSPGIRAPSEFASALEAAPLPAGGLMARALRETPGALGPLASQGTEQAVAERGLEIPGTGYSYYESRDMPLRQTRAREEAERATRERQVQAERQERERATLAALLPIFDGNEAEARKHLPTAIARPNYINELGEQQGERKAFDAMMPEQRKYLGRAGEAFVPGFRYSQYLSSFAGREQSQANRVDFRVSFPPDRGGGDGDGETAGGMRAARNEARSVAHSTAVRLIRENPRITDQELRNHLARNDTGFKDILDANDRANAVSGARTATRTTDPGRRSNTARPAGGAPSPASSRSRRGSQRQPASSQRRQPATQRPTAATKQRITRQEYDALRGQGFSDQQIRAKYEVR